MLNKNYIKISIVWTLGLIMFSALLSCEKFLNQEPKYLLTPEGAVTDQASAESILNGAYSFLGKDAYTVRFTGGFSSMLGIVNAVSLAYNFNMNATGDSKTLWDSFYSTVNGANAVIAAVEPLPESAFKDPSRKNGILGEARIIRAFANTYVLWYFGRWWDDPSSPFGIIYRDQLSALENVYQPRISVGDSYNKIIEDLDFAIQHAPEWTTGVRASKQLAQALKAKLLLYRGRGDDYHEALPLLSAVIERAPALGLALEPSLTELYEKSWDSDELLFCRYREKTDDVVSAYNFTYGYNYATLTLTDLGRAYLQADSRHEEAWGDIRSPVTNNNTMYWAPKKLARKGRQEGGDNDKYTVYFMRLTELHLLKAELLEKTGASLTIAMEPINYIRTRSELPELTVTDKQEFYDILFQEILMELHLENEADFMAAVRFRAPTGERLIFNLRTTLAGNEDRFIYPLPGTEMNFNPYMQGMQNPGYENLTY